MKFLLALVLLFLIPIQGYTQTVNHSHGGKNHTHPLPNTGLNHTHRGVQGTGKIIGNTVRLETNPTTLKKEAGSDLAKILIGKTIVFPKIKYNFPKIHKSMLPAKLGSKAIYFVDEKTAIYKNLNGRRGTRAAEQKWFFHQLNSGIKLICIMGADAIDIHNAFHSRKNSDGKTVCATLKSYNSKTIIVKNPEYFLSRIRLATRQAQIIDGDKYNLLDELVTGYARYVSGESKLQKGLVVVGGKSMSEARSAYNKLSKILLSKKNAKNTNFYQEKRERGEKIKKIAEDKRKQKLIKESAQRSAQLKAGFDPKGRVSKNSSTIPNLSISMPFAPNLDKNTITYPIVFAGISKDGKDHSAKIQVILEMKVKTIQHDCAFGIGRCRKESNEIKRDSKIINISLNPRNPTIHKMNLSLFHTVNKTPNPIADGIKTVLPENPTVRYKVLDFK